MLSYWYFNQEAFWVLVTISAKYLHGYFGKRLVCCFPNFVLKHGMTTSISMSVIPYALLPAVYCMQGGILKSTNF